MENGRFDELPAPVYIRSFLENYCEYLELDFNPLWEKLHPPPPVETTSAGLDQSPAEDESAPVPDIHPAPPAAQAPKASAGSRSPYPQTAAGLDQRSSQGSRSPYPQTAAGLGPRAQSPGAAPRTQIPLERSPYLASFISSLGAVLLTFALAAILTAWTLYRARTQPEAQSVQQPPALMPIGAALEKRLSIVFRDDAWISLRADGATIYEGRVPKNARQEWRAQRTMKLDTNRPEALELTLNGAPFRLPRPEAGGGFPIEVQP
jgi:hypothetical protein